jgi:hypothetical protein
MEPIVHTPTSRKGWIEWKVDADNEFGWEARVMPDFRSDPSWGRSMHYGYGATPVEALGDAMRKFAESMCAGMACSEKPKT